MRRVRRASRLALVAMRGRVDDRATAHRLASGVGRCRTRGATCIRYRRRNHRSGSPLARRACLALLRRILRPRIALDRHRERAGSPCSHRHRGPARGRCGRERVDRTVGPTRRRRSTSSVRTRSPRAPIPPFRSQPDSQEQLAPLRRSARQADRAPTRHDRAPTVYDRSMPR
jgi:hypothetical protein